MIIEVGLLIYIAIPISNEQVGRSEKKQNFTYLLTCTDLRRSLSNESGVVFQCTGHLGQPP